MRIRTCLLAAILLLLNHAAIADDIGVVGLFPGKAVLIVGSAQPKTYSVGDTISDGVKLVAADHISATIETKGKRQVIAIGQHFNRSSNNSNSANSSGNANNTITLQADSKGHFTATVQINGTSMPMLVDTGATLIAIPSSEALRFGIDYKKGQAGLANTANGNVAVYKVRLDSVKIGDIVVNQVDAIVQESGLSIGLLGMSFLSRTEMRQDGTKMTLTKRF